MVKKAGLTSSFQGVEHIKEFFNKVKGKMRKDTLPAQEFPMPKSHTLPPVFPEKEKRPADPARLHEKTPFVFPEIRLPEKKPDEHRNVDKIINVIYDEVRKNHELPEKQHLQEDIIIKDLFFEKLERLFKETQLTEAEIKNVVEKDILSRMKEFHQAKQDGTPYVFDRTDLDSHIRKKIDHLKELEADWAHAATELDVLKKTMQAREEELSHEIESLKAVISASPMKKHEFLEKKDQALQILAKEKEAEAHSMAIMNDLQLQGMLAVTDLSGKEGINLMNTGAKIFFRGEQVEKGTGTSQVSSPSIVVQERMLPAELSFCFVNGETACSLAELKEKVSTVPLSVLDTHINVQENHFAPWISLFGNKQLAQIVAGLSSSEEFIALMQKISIK
jgi:hypothetical protein